MTACNSAPAKHHGGGPGQDAATAEERRGAPGKVDILVNNAAFQQPACDIADNRGELSDRAPTTGGIPTCTRLIRIRVNAIVCGPLRAPRPTPAGLADQVKDCGTDTPIPAHHCGGCGQIASALRVHGRGHLLEPASRPRSFPGGATRAGDCGYSGWHNAELEKR